MIEPQNYRTADFAMVEKLFIRELNYRKNLHVQFVNLRFVTFYDLTKRRYERV